MREWIPEWFYEGPNNGGHTYGSKKKKQNVDASLNSGMTAGEVVTSEWF